MRLLDKMTVGEIFAGIYIEEIRKQGVNRDVRLYV